MDKHLYYRVMMPTAIVAFLMFFIPNLPLRSIFGFLIIFIGLGRYGYLLYKK
ncbi:hypothetical protein ACTNBL_08615 [Enterococcus villorum]|jgi:hypothetical protein|uniref:Uncharacterized protein n=2 Tax=Enterococcus villorum TaxID=112904 RepID=A0A511IZ37_9ENTE|nr:hypothetical protein [Enterococcus villorum]EOH87451.1 hypothetical protein UAO_02162 [Enterococcus villorum ATCC 700913]EOW77830.1 hypothetical protein I591_00684 [Enterococcus villorum ATCC 700913]GEL91004.1 hypothetical protein EVI01_03410 [Enterococcus villorum]